MNHSLNKVFLLVTILCGGLFFSGCTSLISPYNSEFQCPNVDKGKCVSVKTAYDQSLENSGNPLVRDNDSCTKDKKKSSVQPSAPLTAADSGSKSAYQNAMYHRLASLIRQPTPPLVAPPEVMRVLILSYTGSDNKLFSFRYVYFFASDPKWIYSTATDGVN